MSVPISGTEYLGTRYQSHIRNILIQIYIIYNRCILKYQFTYMWFCDNEINYTHLCLSSHYCLVEVLLPTASPIWTLLSIFLLTEPQPGSLHKTSLCPSSPKVTAFSLNFQSPRGLLIHLRGCYIVYWPLLVSSTVIHLLA